MKLTIKKALFVITALMTALGMVAQAQAFKAKLSGQVNQLIMYADDGEENDFYVADNDNSSTRFRFTGEQEVDALTIGFKTEFEAERNSSSKLTLPNDGDGDFDFNDRWLEAYFDTKFGKVSLGKGDGAANNTSEVDLSGTSVIMYAGVNDTAGGFEFVDKDTGLQSGTSIGDTRNNFDGLSRNERIRYDTPKFFGTHLAGSITNGNAWELAAFFANEFGGHKIAAAAGYVDTQDRGSSEYTQLGISASWLAPFGLNLTGAYGMRWFQGATQDAREADGKEDKATNYYGKFGWKFAEIHAVAVEYGMTEDLDESGDKSSNWGLAYVVKPWQGVELYASGRQYFLDRDVGTFKDFYQVMAGTRIKF